MDKRRILIVCDSPRIQTGYARLGRFIAKTLADAGYDVHYLPCNTDVDNDEIFPYTLFPFEAGDRYFVGRFFDVLNQVQPSMVLAIGEFGFVGYVSSYTKDLGIKSMYYMPVEGRNYPPSEMFQDGRPIDILVRVAKFDYIVAYSNFGKQEISKLLPGIVTDVVPHQVDLNIFRPLDKQACLKIYLPQLVEHFGFENIFLVGSVCRNQRRKGTDLIMRSFKEFLQYENPKKKMFLMMVTDEWDPQGFNLRNMVKLYGLEGRVVHIPNVGGVKGIPDNGLAELYNCMDVHLCPFRAEGWGFQILESLACGTHVIATHYATPAEYAKDACMFVEPVDFEPQLGTNCEWAVLSPKDIAKALHVFYDMPWEHTKRPYAAAVECAQNYSEEVVGKKWVELLQGLNLPEKGKIKLPQEQLKDYQQSVMDQYIDLVGG